MVKNSGENTALHYLLPSVILSASSSSSFRLNSVCNFASIDIIG